MAPHGVEDEDIAMLDVDSVIRPNSRIADSMEDPMEDPVGPEQVADEEEEEMFEDEGDAFEDEEEQFAQDEAAFAKEEELFAKEEELFNEEQELSDQEQDLDEADAQALDISSSEDEDDDAPNTNGVPLPRAISPSSLVFDAPSAGALSTTAPSITSVEPSLHPQRPIPYTHDAGHLLVNDTNTLNLPSAQLAREAVLSAIARDAAQSLLNHLLTTCPIHASSSLSGPVRAADAGVYLVLPPPTTPLPREKPVPKPKEPTKWEAFARKKGIGKFGGVRKGQEGEGRAGKMVWDEEKREWVPRYGYKGANKKGQGEWLVEVDETKERKAVEEKGVAGVDPRSLKRAERKERMRRNERAQRANDRRARKGKA